MKSTAQERLAAVVARDFPPKVVDPWKRLAQRRGLTEARGWSATIYPLLGDGTIVYVLRKTWRRPIDGGRCEIVYDGERREDLLARASAFEREEGMR